MGANQPTKVLICFSMTLVLSRRRTTFRVATARHAIKSVELNVKVTIATIYQRNEPPCSPESSVDSWPTNRPRGERDGGATAGGAEDTVDEYPIGITKGEGIFCVGGFGHFACELGNVQSPGAGIGLSEGSR